MDHQVQIQLGSLADKEPVSSRATVLSHSEVRFSSHKVFPPRLKFKAQTDNPKLWNYKRREEFRPINPVEKAKTQRQLREDIPGPGSYQTEHKSKSILGTIARKPTHKMLPSFDEVGPGPGFYNITTVWKGRQSKPSFNSQKLKQLFQSIHESTPGPGQYRQQIGNKPITSKYRSASTCVISKTAKQCQFQLNTPGPGTYISPKQLAVKVKKSPFKFLHRYMT